MKELMLSLVVWLGANSEYHFETQLPQIRQLTMYELCRTYGIQDMERCDSARLKAFYDREGTIYLSSDFDAENIYDKSRLLHELVHHGQWLAGKQQQHCLGHLELEAYTLQDQWRNERGLEPTMGEFRRMMLAASCED